MICYNHPENQAHGICKNCNKGICAKCSTDLGDGLACTASCVAEVNEINELVQKSKQTQNSFKSRGNAASIFFLVFGMLMLSTSYLLNRIDPFLIGMGVLFLVYGVFTLIKTNQKDKTARF